MTTIRISGDRQTGKTEMCLMIAARALREGKKVFWVGVDRKTCQDTSGRLLNMLHGEEVRKVYASGEIVMRNGAFIQFNGDVAGWQPDVVIIDEAISDVDHWAGWDPRPKVYRTTL